MCSAINPLRGGGSSQESPCQPEIPTALTIQSVRNKVQLFREESKTIGERGFFTPPNRYCDLELHDYLPADTVLSVYAQQFLPTPFLDLLRIEETLNTLEQMEKEGTHTTLINRLLCPMNFAIEQAFWAVGTTQKGRHVILQQASESCVPSCIGMLVLDHGKVPNYWDIIKTDGAILERATKWVKEAGLVPMLYSISRESGVADLCKLLAEHGPGVLAVNYHNHAIVFDEISEEKQTVDIRDPLNGQAETIPLTFFTTEMLPKTGVNNFLQVRELSPGESLPAEPQKTMRLFALPPPS